jgi:hypothetical protein
MSITLLNFALSIPPFFKSSVFTLNAPCATDSTVVLRLSLDPEATGKFVEAVEAAGMR